MTETTQTQCKDGKASDWTMMALVGMLGMLLIVLGTTSHFNLVNEQISVVLCLVLTGVAIATICNWARSYKTCKASPIESFRQ